jgi:hypothetical protein
MMVIDMTAQIGPVIVGLNTLLLVAAAILVATVWNDRVDPAPVAFREDTTETAKAIVRLSPRGLASSCVSSVPEAA